MLAAFAWRCRGRDHLVKNCFGVDSEKIGDPSLASSAALRLSRRPCLCLVLKQAVTRNFMRMVCTLDEHRAPGRCSNAGKDISACLQPWLVKSWKVKVLRTNTRHRLIPHIDGIMKDPESAENKQRQAHLTKQNPHVSVLQIRRK